MTEVNPLFKTTIQIDGKVKKRLDKLKVHPREPYNDVIKRLLQFYEKYSRVVE